MATSFFDDKGTMPSDAMVEAVLGDAKPLWDQVRAYASDHFPRFAHEWKFYSKKAGWSLVCRAKDKTLFYFLPREGYFMIFLVFGVKAWKAAEQSPIPEHMKETIAAAPRYAEGTSFFIEVKDKMDVAPVCMLIKIKDES